MRERDGWSRMAGEVTIQESWLTKSPPQESQQNLIFRARYHTDPPYPGPAQCTDQVAEEVDRVDPELPQLPVPPAILH